MRAVDRVRAGGCGVVGLAAVNAEDGSEARHHGSRLTIRVRRVAPHVLSRVGEPVEQREERAVVLHLAPRARADAILSAREPFQPQARPVIRLGDVARTEVEHLQRRGGCGADPASRSGAVRGGEHAARHRGTSPCRSTRPTGRAGREVSRCSRDSRQRPPARANRDAWDPGRGGPRRDGTSRPPPPASPPRPRGTPARGVRRE